MVPRMTPAREEAGPNYAEAIDHLYGCDDLICQDCEQARDLLKSWWATRDAAIAELTQEVEHREMEALSWKNRCEFADSLLSRCEEALKTRHGDLCWSGMFHEGKVIERDSTCAVCTLLSDLEKRGKV